MLLAIDVGNTNIVLGVFRGTTLEHSWRLATIRERTADEIGLLIEGLFAKITETRRLARSAASIGRRSF